MKNSFTPGAFVRAAKGTEIARILSYEGECFYLVHLVERDGRSLLVHEDDLEIAVPCWRCKLLKMKYTPSERFKGKWLATCSNCGYVEGLFPVAEGKSVAEEHERWLRKEWGAQQS